MDKMIIQTLVLGMVQTNCYIIHMENSKEAVVIDPADQAAEILQTLQANDLVCEAILLTHGHFDHILAVRELAEATNAPVYVQEEEVQLLGNADLNASSLRGSAYTLTPDRLLKDEEVLNIAGLSINVIHTPGHTIGSACYYFAGQGILFSGDTLFLECIGRTDLPTGNQSAIIQSIRSKLLLLEDQVKVYPGHGDTTTIGYERDNNRYITNRYHHTD